LFICALLNGTLSLDHKTPNVGKMQNNSWTSYGSKRSGNDFRHCLDIHVADWISSNSQDIRLRVQEIQDLPSMKKYQQLKRKDQTFKNIYNLSVSHNFLLYYIYKW